MFEFVTGVLNIQYFYVFPGSFYTLHYYGAWVFTAAFVAHVTLKLPTMVRSLRRRKLRDELRTDTAHTEPEPPDDTGLVSDAPAAATISRRGVLGLVAASSATLFAVTVGQSIGGSFRRTALLAPRYTDPGSGPNGFQINKRAKEVGVTEDMTGPSWRLTLHGAKQVVLTRAQLRALPQHTSVPADLVRRGLDDRRPDVARRTAARPRGAGRDAGTRVRCWSSRSSTAGSEPPPCGTTRSWTATACSP